MSTGLWLLVLSFLYTLAADWCSVSSYSIAVKCSLFMTKVSKAMETSNKSCSISEVALS